MSITGSNYYGYQNIENTNPIDGMSTDIDTIQYDILQNSDDISTNAYNIDVLEYKTQKQTYRSITDDPPPGLFPPDPNTTIFDSKIFCTGEIKVDTGSGVVSVISRSAQHTSNINALEDMDISHSADISANSAAIDEMALLILANENAINAIDISGIPALVFKTQKQTYDDIALTTVFDSKLWCDRDIFVTSDSYGTISLAGNHQKILANSNFTLTGTTLYCNNTANKLMMDQEIDMSLNCIDNLSCLILRRGNGGINDEDDRVVANLWSDIMHTINYVDGGSFRFTTVKAGEANRDFDINHDNVDFDGGVIANCPTITNIETITDKFTYIGTTLSLNSPVTQLQMHQDSNMYGNDINTIKSLKIVNYSPTIQSGETLRIQVSYDDALFLQRANTTTGGVFKFSTMKGTTEHFLDIKHDEVDVHDKDLFNQ
jgi:hypothetical protein